MRAPDGPQRRTVLCMLTFLAATGVRGRPLDHIWIVQPPADTHGRPTILLAPLLAPLHDDPLPMTQPWAHMLFPYDSFGLASRPVCLKALQLTVAFAQPILRNLLRPLTQGTAACVQRRAELLLQKWFSAFPTASSVVPSTGPPSESCSEAPMDGSAEEVMSAAAMQPLQAASGLDDFPVPAYARVPMGMDMRGFNPEEAETMGGLLSSLERQCEGDESQLMELLRAMPAGTTSDERGATVTAPPAASEDDADGMGPEPMDEDL